MRDADQVLRVAESRDRSHAQAITGLELRDRGEDALLLVHTATDAELEIWATNRHLQPFEKLLGKPIRLEAATIAPAPVVNRQPRRRTKTRTVRASRQGRRTMTVSSRLAAKADV